MAAKISPLNAGWIVLIVYAVGIAGFMIPQTAKWMPNLIWINLLFTLIVLLSYHKKWNKEFVFSALLCGACGFLIEVLGVKTGKIFGSYSYGSALGYKLWETPVMMAVTWLTCIYTSRQIAESIAKDAFLVSVIASSLMLILDFFIEPFAIRYDMWKWNAGVVPMQNYIAWFVFGILLQYLFIRSVKFPGNKLALPIYCIQLGFFIALFFLKK